MQNAADPTNLMDLLSSPEGHPRFRAQGGLGYTWVVSGTGFHLALSKDGLLESMTLSTRRGPFGFSRVLPKQARGVWLLLRSHCVALEAN